MVKIRLPPQCQINYVSIQGTCNYLKMRYINVANNVHCNIPHNYVDIRGNYIDMKLKLSRTIVDIIMSHVDINKLHVNIIIYVAC